MSEGSSALAGEDRAPAVAVVIVNWRAAAMTLAAVRRALAQSLPPARIYVVDNGSGDDSAQVLAPALARMDDRIVFLRNAANVGFGGGCNPALAAALSARIDHVWLLNNDALPAPDCLERLVAAAGAAPAPVGIVGSLLIDPQGAAPPHYGSWLDPVKLTCGAVSPTDGPDRHRFAWMTAASMLVSTDALRAAGLFDPAFFMYWEDADLNMRIRAAGYSIVAAPDAVVEHHAGTSSSDIPVQRYLWHLASQDRFLTKHHPAPCPARIALRVKYLLKALIDRDMLRFRAILRVVAGSLFFPPRPDRAQPR